MTSFRIRTLLGGRRPRYADVAATLALLFAMGGTAYAATSLGPNTVGTVQLKDNAVTNPKIDSHAVSAGKLGPEAVTNPKLADGSVTNFKLGTGVVTHSKLGPSSIDGSNVAAESLSLADLVGANKSGAISFSRPAGTCGTLSLGVSGAQVGQAVLFTFTGTTAVPTSIVFGGAKITAANTIAVKYCNAGASNVSVSNLGIRVVTFG
jgi:hypothetical protein